ncbi:MAG: heme lyase CcmF/NrfE family subunit, partial [Acidimicrobiia bacterium]|nr:heme lyase CcmF/NrfE family subunit [Acidimicrobiia bacterium]
MNLLLGRAGVTLGLAAAILGVVTLAYGLARRRPDIVRLSRWYALMVFGGGLLAAVAMERALITRDFTVEYVAQN